MWTLKSFISEPFEDRAARADHPGLISSIGIRLVARARRPAERRERNGKQKNPDLHVCNLYSMI
jgi:hypothetical protein